MRELIERLEERVSDIWDIVDELEKKFGEVLAVPNDKALKAVVKVTRSRIKLHKDGYYTADDKDFGRIEGEFFKRYGKKVKPQGKKSIEDRMFGISRSVMKKYGDSKIRRFIKDHEAGVLEYARDNKLSSRSDDLQTPALDMAKSIVDSYLSDLKRYLEYASMDKSQLVSMLADSMYDYAMRKM